MRQKALNLLQGKRDSEFLCFSGMGNVTTEGMKATGIRFAQAHTDAGKMAKLAATSFRLFGFQSAVVPFDVAIEAELLGCPINFYTEVDPQEILYPTVKEKTISSAAGIRIPSDLANAGRVPMVRQALSLLKSDVGGEIPIGTYIMGPFTVAGQTMELDHLLKLCLKKPEEVSEILGIYSSLIVELAKSYFAAGADYITIREMGACSDVLRPTLFRSLVEPHLKDIFRKSAGPLVLHICGKSNGIIDSMNGCGASALSVDQKNDLRQTRESIGKAPVVLGNFDPYNVLVRGTPQDVRRAVAHCIEDGVDAVWPGCDIWPTAPRENMEALMAAVAAGRRERK
ncbi:MAG: methyltransferase [Candidatus Abyssobacteria bacterium SURF_5]|uniref:Methyltransferase n=1 Tax=Abyssobacteria bacterium (strain SURF_5) TaxID=2093360 RepID=A0A3A4NQG2_ABYX5|nr:MAG: methyltransferase [Candidatus Abyssubacteria bacterium SURF_5]